MRIVLVNVERKGEAAAFVHALIRLNSQNKVEDIVRIWEVCLHGAAERNLCDIYTNSHLNASPPLVELCRADLSVLVAEQQ